MSQAFDAQSRPLAQRTESFLTQTWQRRSQAQFRALVQQATAAILLVNPKTHAILDANPIACTLLGYSLKDLCACALSDIDDQFNLAFPTRRPQVVGFPILLESIYRRQDGTTLPVQVNSNLLELEQHILEVVCIQDLTEQKHREQAIAHLSKVGELAAMIVHELRNPLTTVLLGLETFQKLDLPADAQARLALVMDESDRLKRLLSEILLYTKPQVSQLHHLELNLFIQSMLYSLRNLPAAAHRQIEFSSTVPSAWIRGDCDKLKQILINLVKNACEAIPDKETVWCRLSPGPTSQQVCLEVQNRGEPIPAHLLPQVTKPFFTTKLEGTGLGLAIVQRLVEAHEGEFTIESTRASGTIVRLQLPLVTPKFGHQ
jgi:two-component system, sporulation sensor kinase E